MIHSWELMELFRILLLGHLEIHKDLKKIPPWDRQLSAEILAIPEIWEKKLFSVIDLTSVQIAGGPEFDAEFLESDDSIIIGQNPLYLDYYALKFIEQKRKQRGLLNRFGGKYPLFRFARELNLGDAYSSNLIELK